ncbi:MAG: 30S ribosome-binding factor RbfA [Armatimonadota bacterium]|nr:30S ribosome-binding factor RbfA [bacterium]MDW8321550.1 30S ribosome-binding factor RbfA [Armatimonadota bacterium]
MSSNRVSKIESLLVSEISDIVHNELKDPRLDGVTITQARVSRDLSHAKVYVSALKGVEARDKALEVLRNLAGRIRGEFGRRVHLRVVPEIQFEPDEGIEAGMRVHELLRQLEQR